jgi:hypothetical protein
LRQQPHGERGGKRDADIRRSAGRQFTLDTLEDLLAVDLHMGWRLDADARLLALNTQNGHSDFTIDSKDFAYTAGEDKHGISLFQAERIPAALLAFAKNR